MKLEKFVKRKKDTACLDVCLQDIVEQMFKYSLRYVVIVSNDIPIGILTERDVLSLFHENIDFRTTKIAQFALKKLVKASKERELEYALNLMIDHNIRRVIVVDNEGKYKGCVEQEEIIFEFEAHSLQKELKIFQILMNESIALSVDKETSLGKALQIMQENNFGSLLIYQDDTPVGILTETDIVKLAKENIDKKLPVKLYMHSPVIMVGLKTSMYECLEIMKKNNIRRLVVKENDDSEKKLYYVITSKDILNNLKGNYSKFLEAKLLSYRNTFDNLNDLIIETYNFEDSHVVSWINKSAKKKLNIEIDDAVEKLIPKPILEQTYEAFKTQDTYICNRVMIGEKIYRYSASKVALFDISIVKILLSDFTELYLSNTKLKEQIGMMSESMSEQESMQLEILNQEAIGIGYSTISGEILFINSYLRKLLGYEEDELIGQNIDEVTFFQDYENSLQRRKELINDRNIDNLTFEKRYLQKNGTPIWVHVSLSVSRDKMGKAKYLIAFIKDIEERKVIQKKLELSDGVFQNSNEGIVITDRELKIQAVNPAFSDITQYSEEEAIGKNTLFLRSTYHDSEFYKQIWKSTLQSGYWKGEMWSVRKNGELFPQWLNISTIKDSSGKIQNYIGIFFDITSMKQSEEELEFLAHHDPLTELPNRLLLSARLNQSIKRAKREAKKIALLFLDLDRFKEINDTFGHSYGDEILVSVTHRFKACMRENDTIARIGGDEFVFLIEDIEDVTDLQTIINKILELFDKEIIVNKQSFKLSASIGISLYPDDGDNIEDLIKNADTAMYKAKDSGRNTYRFYTEQMTQDLFSKMLMKKEILGGLENNEFVLFYQPQVSLDSGRILGAEALVRWQHPQMGLLYPDRFIHLAEQTKLIVPLGRYILLKACQQMKEWVDNQVICGRLAVNISAIQIQQNNLYQEVIDVLTQTKLSGSYLEFEITESFMMENPQASIALFKKLKNLGISFSIDDFGTGYSSLNYLKQLPVDKLKIDRSFIMDIPEDKEDIAITSTIIAMSKNLGLNVIAEGIETKEQHEFLKSSGCYEGQGYYYSKPLSKVDFEKFLIQSKKN
jgi:diguanylate cyclase (GGDEF)-like protein/PAS domain S-box-containing protein